MPLDYPAFSLNDVPADQRTVEQERDHRRRMCALGYRIFGAMRWGQLGDGHITEVVANVAANIFSNYLNHVAETDIDFPAVRLSVKEAA